MRLNQRGMIDFMLIAALVTVAAVGSFVFWQIVSSDEKVDEPIVAVSEPVESQAETTVSPADPVAEEVPPNGLVQTTYPASATNPVYNLLFFPDITTDCDDAAGVCGDLIANVSGGRSVSLLMSDLSLDSTQAIAADSQCKPSNVQATHNGVSVEMCETGFGSDSVGYYKFEVVLGGRTHVGTFTGVNPKQQRFLEVNNYKQELVSIIESLAL